MLLHNLIRKMGVTVNLLHIIQLFQRIDPLPTCRASVASAGGSPNRR